MPEEFLALLGCTYHVVCAIFKRFMDIFPIPTTLWGVMPRERAGQRSRKAVILACRVKAIIECVSGGSLAVSSVEALKVIYGGLCIFDHMCVIWISLSLVWRICVHTR